MYVFKMYNESLQSSFNVSCKIYIISTISCCFLAHGNRLCGSAINSRNHFLVRSCSDAWDEQAVDLHVGLHESTQELPPQGFIHLLNMCSAMETIHKGHWVHMLVVKGGLEVDSYISCSLINMYVKCGEIQRAQTIFESLPTRVAENWNPLIIGYAHCQKGDLGIKLFKRMQQEGIKPSRVTFLCVLKACSDLGSLDEGRLTHASLIENGFEFSTFVENALIDMYVKCSSLDDAHNMFARSSKSDVGSFNALIGGYAQDGDLQPAFFLFMDMQENRVHYDHITFVSILKACSINGNLLCGQHVHSRAVEFEFESDEHVINSLLHMYMSCGCIEDARVLFERMQNQNVVIWTTLVSGLAQNGRVPDAFEVVNEMKKQGIQLNEITYISILKGCSAISAPEIGRSAHADLIEGGYNGSLCLGNALIDMYSKCGSLEDATALFLGMPSRDIVTWTTLIAAYSLHGCGQEAFSLFDQMQKEGFLPNPVTFATLLKSSAHRGVLHEGRHIHACIVENGLESDAYVGNSLVDMYFQCCCSDDAVDTFNKMGQRDIISWNTLISGYFQNGECFQALQCYWQMQAEGSVEPDSITFMCALKSCVGIADFKQGICIHAKIISSSHPSDGSVGSMLIELYAKFGHLEDACRVFSSLPERNVVTWNVLMKGFADAGECNQALELFSLMQEDGVMPDVATLLCAIKSCSTVGALQHGQMLHMQCTLWGLDIHLSIKNSFISMYSSVGRMDEAQAVFDKSCVQDGVGWTTLITGYAQQHRCLEALRCYESMLEHGQQPDQVTLVCTLTACSRGGLRNEGFRHFKSMRDELGIQPTIEHYNPLIDLLTHGGALHEAEDLLESLPFEKNMVGWMSLLGACRNLSNQGIARRCFDNVVKIDPSNASAYVIMSNFYTQLGQLEEAKNIEELRKVANAWKIPAKAFIEIDGQVHEFIVGDRRHPKRDAIDAKLNHLNAQMKREGYRPRVDLVPAFSVDENQEKALCGHAEKLAIALGLLTSSSESTLRVTKNLRMCDDCHAVTKFISKIETRNIVVKDAYCVHLFQKGLCSCEI
ncbi:hypothetical protein KP509_18G024700 [Ceratopteris richardii]|uniref:DYW domain-containing protein n=1 Tax=Ceratopteris richardii TaxID=49495 RepID=A0A8T2SRF9_CERRI|nr:hypothetical protein KP509_18G024700 [Ceratopteris richardii]